MRHVLITRLVWLMAGLIVSACVIFALAPELTHAMARSHPCRVS